MEYVYIATNIGDYTFFQKKKNFPLLSYTWRAESLNFIFQINLKLV